jgi:hypothetical protein
MTKLITSVLVPLGSMISWHTIDTEARPVLIRAREGETSLLFFIEMDPTPPFPGSMSLTLYATTSGISYPGNYYRYFSSCLTPSGEDLIHGLYYVAYTSRPSRMTQPELPGPVGPPGPTGAMGPGGPIGVTWSPST